MDISCTRTDDELVVAFAEGDNNAFDRLLERHRQALFSYIFYIIHDSDVANDIFQETCFKAILSIKQDRYTSNGTFRAWIMRIAHNLMIDHFRQKKNENSISRDAYEVDLLNHPSLCEETVETVIARTQVLNDVKKMIRFLPDSQRTVLEMRYYRELSFKDIAEATGVSINTALGRMRYAIMNMRKMAYENNIILTIN